MKNNSTAERIRFFNVSLGNAHPMSRPKYEPQQALIADLIQSLERMNPRFAWIQFHFVERDYNPWMTDLKWGLRSWVRDVETTPDYDSEGNKRDNKWLNSEWFHSAPAKTKKIEEAGTQLRVLLAIHGMWVSSSESAAYEQLRHLPFANCFDEIDRLQVFTYYNPAILRALVYRRMVTDISKSLSKYHGSREEPPSMVITPEEIPYYVHMSTGNRASGLASISEGPHFPSAASAHRAYDGKTEGQKESSVIWNIEESSEDERTAVAELTKIPTPSIALAKDEAKRLRNLVSTVQRSFEIVYDRDGRKDAAGSKKPLTSILLSSKSKADLERAYIPQLSEIYGSLKYQEVEKIPPFVTAELPRSVE